MNFAVILFLLTLVTGAFWFFELLVMRPKRRRKVEEHVRTWEANQMARGGEVSEAGRQAVRDAAMERPWWLDYTAGLFPVFIVVFVLRSFLFEPFKIPSGSMIPTLLVGDLILVNKFTYGVRLPIVHTKVINVGEPKRGDVMVFRYPLDPSVDYIKRVVGLPGDTLTIQGNRITINGQLVPMERIGEFYDVERSGYAPLYSEKLGEVTHNLLTELDNSTFIRQSDREVQVPVREHCKPSPGGFTCQIPAGNYFMMGDNREHSQDSRSWGFVPEANIVGKAFFIWMNFSDLKRIGSFR